MKQVSLRILAVFFISATLLAYELGIMRIFSVGNWSNFGSMVISIGLLGFGAAGTLLTFIHDRIRRHPQRWMEWLSILLLPAMAGAQAAAQYVPFNPVFIVSDPRQVMLLGVFYLLYAIPFFTGAMFIGISFTTLSSRIYKLYFWNMIGSGIGVFVILACMYILPPEKLIIPILALGLIASLLCLIRISVASGSTWIPLPQFALSLGSFIVSLVIIFVFGKIQVSDFKAISYARRFPDSVLEHRSFGPIGEMHVYSSAYFHFAPGLSDNATINLKTLPNQAYMGLYIDGNGPIGIMRKLVFQEADYLDYLPMTAPYLLLTSPKVLLVKLGGGISAFTSLHNNAGSVQVVESNPAVVSLLKDDPVIRKYNGNLLQDPRVKIRVDEPRAYCATTKERFNLVEISLIDSIGLSQDGGYPVEENYIYTVEAIKDYMRCLLPGGILSLTIWNKLDPPRNVPKLLATMVESLVSQGIKNPGQHLFVFDLLYSTATILVKSTPFTWEEIQTLKDFCETRSFEIIHYPGIPLRDKNFERILRTYRDIFKKNRAVSGSSTDVPELLPGDLYHFTLAWLLSDLGEELEHQYIFDIRPAHDDRPYYSAYIKPLNIGWFLDQLKDVSDEWGYLMLAATFVQSIFFSIFIILIPVIGKRVGKTNGNAGSGTKKVRGTTGIIIYFICLGLGYMIVEIFLIQQLILFLADPIFSVSIVITTLLVVSGCGSLFSQIFRKKRTLGIRVAVGILGLTILFYLFGLPILLRHFLGSLFIIRVLLSIAFIIPAAFCLGMPFPSGLSALTENRPVLLPWAWGVNGAFSVSGTILARLVSVSFGFNVTLLVALSLYIVAAVLFPRTETR
ncbi:MAG: hypothetical protein AB1798_09165 [Spirochaetota bacterium]